MINKNHTTQKINKSLLALACGDSYGSFYEYEGLCGSKFNIDTLPNKPLKPNITDDTKMSLLLLKHYHKYKTIKQDILLNEYRYWAKTDGDKDGIGIHTKEVLLYNKKDKNSQGNGALMRNIPFGVQLIDDGYSFEDALRLMCRDSSLTHENETVFLANRLMLDLAINGIKQLEKPIYKPLVLKFHRGYSAWIIHTLHIVTQTLIKKHDLLSGFKYIVSHGGDTDTNCAIFGAVYGYTKEIQKEISIKDFLGDLVDTSITVA